MCGSLWCRSRAIKKRIAGWACRSRNILRLACINSGGRLIDDRLTVLPVGKRPDGISNRLFILGNFFSLICFWCRFFCFCFRSNVILRGRNFDIGLAGNHRFNHRFNHWGNHRLSSWCSFGFRDDRLRRRTFPGHGCWSGFLNSRLIGRCSLFLKFFQTLLIGFAARKASGQHFRCLIFPGLGFLKIGETDLLGYRRQRRITHRRNLAETCNTFIFKQGSRFFTNAVNQDDIIHKSGRRIGCRNG